jgi:hypothetical protein
MTKLSIIMSSDISWEMLLNMLGKRHTLSYKSCKYVITLMRVVMSVVTVSSTKESIRVFNNYNSSSDLIGFLAITPFNNQMQTHQMKLNK